MNVIYQNQAPVHNKKSEDLIEIRDLNTKDLFKGSSLADKILFILEGELTGGFAKNSDMVMPSGYMLLLPAGQEYCFYTANNVRFMIIRLTDQVRFCESYLIDKLTAQIQVLEKYHKEKSCLLRMNWPINIYVNSLECSFNKNLSYAPYFETKIRELFYLLEAHYSHEHLAYFFRDALSPDSLFSHFIINNYHKYNTLTHIADAVNMSVSGFEKRFKKVFTISPAKWMNDQKAQVIQAAIRNEKTPLKELAIRFGFATKSTFNDFCKRNLGNTPGEIRKMEGVGGNEK